ncbi:hypothetical protein [Xylocopilactobacillus apis]|uniref:Uncharacterized protein n=1 Tax=Xylocopilactobacillus apis TaxID=2932183 RepID=A0AAU9CTN7_9LACO|nr:hypothetical protein [Xylocopilactobacillus apis]BDR57337.1 hypothetical protein KIMC2_18990 [Xylocopilactobacillus apis]
MNSIKRLLTITGAMITITGATSIEAAINPNKVQAAAVESHHPLILHERDKTFIIERSEKLSKDKPAMGVLIPQHAKPGDTINIHDNHNVEIAVFKLNNPAREHIFVVSPKFHESQVYQIKINSDSQKVKAQKVKLPPLSNFTKEDESSKQR